MNLLLLDPEEISDSGEVVLTDRRAKHLRNIVRVTPGRPLRAGIVRGPRLDATVTAVDRQSVTVAVVPTPGEPLEPDGPAVSLVIALPRPQVLHRVLQFAAAMNIKSLDLIAAWRVEKSFFGSPSLRPENLERQLRLGAEQGATTWIPDVAIHPRFAPFLETWTAETDAVQLIAHPGEGAHPLEQVWQPAWRTRPCVLAVGPEGGWIPREVQAWNQVGFQPVHLGPWVLRVEAAVVSLLSQLDLLRRLTPANAQVC